MDSSMYDRIMKLPLFKGVSRENVSYFLEKTPVSFTNYTDGEIISRADEEVDNLRCVIDGNVKIIHPFESFSLEESGCSLIFLNSDRLFGLHRNAGNIVQSDGTCSVMEFSKENYLRLLYHDPVFMINYLNYLSLRGQKGDYALRHFPGAGFGQMISRLILAMTDKNSKLSIRLSGSHAKFAAFAGETEESLHKIIGELSQADIISVSENLIEIHDRDAFLNRFS